jgi:hypothetical protein
MPLLSYNYMPNQTTLNQPADEAKIIAKAIAYTENGGKPNLDNPSSGQSGEMKSIFQFTPDTWEKDSQDVFGQQNIPLNADTESYVASKKIEEWLGKGYTPQQIFSMWNAGIGEPNAYTGKFSNGQSSTGTNKYGVPYNVQSYVQKSSKYLNEFSQTNSALQGNQQQQKPSVSPDQYKSAVATIQGLIQKAQKPTVVATSQPNQGLLPSLLKQSTKNSQA